MTETTLQGKTALITGSSRGIGRALALAFAASGARVAVNYSRDRASGERTVADLPGGPHLLVQADVSDAAQLNHMVDEVYAQFGAIDILVNNAGVHIPHDPVDLDADEWLTLWRKTIDTNITGAAALSVKVARLMMHNGGGKIINISSRAAFIGSTIAPAYSASKAALNSFSQSLARSFGARNVMVYVIAPGFTQSAMSDVAIDSPIYERMRNESPLGRLATPEEIATTALFLAGPGTDFLTGGIIDVMGASYLRC